MSLVAQNFISVLESKQLRYDYNPATETRNENVIVGFSADNVKNLRLIFFFDGNGRSVNIKCFSICKVPDEKLINVFVILNKLNYDYRWVKYYLDDDNEVTLSGDAILDDDSSGDECFEILVRYVNILDECFPEIMKAIWA